MTTKQVQEDSEFQPGELVAGRYLLQAVLGKGGMGVVYVAIDNVFGREVALKSISGSCRRKTEEDREEARRQNRRFDEDLVAQFKTEARATALLNVENVVRVFDAGEHRGIPFLVMERLHGEDLEHRMTKRQGRPLPVEEAVMDILEVCYGVAKAHAYHLFHRDLSARNVFITPEAVKVVDFGLARLEDDSRQTQQGYMRGTWPYTAPERFDGHDAGALGDVYSIGVLLYATLTGGLPFVNPTTGKPLKGSALAQVIVSGRYKPPKERNPDLPEGLAAIIQRAMAKVPADRFPSVHLLARELVLYAPGVGRKYRDYFQRPEPPAQRIEVLTGESAISRKDGTAEQERQILSHFRQKMPFAEKRAGSPLTLRAELGELLKDSPTVEARYDALTHEASLGPVEGTVGSGPATAPERPSSARGLVRSSEQWFGEAENVEGAPPGRGQVRRRAVIGVTAVLVGGTVAALIVMGRGPAPADPATLGAGTPGGPPPVMAQPKAPPTVEQPAAAESPRQPVPTAAAAAAARALAAEPAPAGGGTQRRRMAPKPNRPPTLKNLARGSNAVDQKKGLPLPGM